MTQLDDGYNEDKKDRTCSSYDGHISNKIQEDNSEKWITTSPSVNCPASGWNIENLDKVLNIINFL